jgi:hypothetical protein
VSASDRCYGPPPLFTRRRVEDRPLSAERDGALDDRGSPQLPKQPGASDAAPVDWKEALMGERFRRGLT